MDKHLSVDSLSGVIVPQYDRTKIPQTLLTPFKIPTSIESIVSPSSGELSGFGNDQRVYDARQWQPNIRLRRIRCQEVPTRQLRSSKRIAEASSSYHSNKKRRTATTDGYGHIRKKI